MNLDRYFPAIGRERCGERPTGTRQSLLRLSGPRARRAYPGPRVAAVVALGATVAVLGPPVGVGAAPRFRHGGRR